MESLCEGFVFDITLSFLLEFWNKSLVTCLFTVRDDPSLFLELVSLQAEKGITLISRILGVGAVVCCLYVTFLLPVD